MYEDFKAIKRQVYQCRRSRTLRSSLGKTKSRLQTEVLPRIQVQAEPACATKKPAARTVRWFGLPLPVFRYATAALVFIAFVVGAFYLGRQYQKPGQPTIKVASQSPALQKIEQAEFYYQKAVQSLTEALESYNGGLPPELTE